MLASINQQLGNWEMYKELIHHKCGHVIGFKMYSAKHVTVEPLTIKITLSIQKNPKYNPLSMKT